MAFIGSGVRQKKSKIPNAGNGLFATVPFRKHQPVTWFEGNHYVFSEDDIKLTKQHQPDWLWRTINVDRYTVIITPKTHRPGMGGGGLANFALTHKRAQTKQFPLPAPNVKIGNLQDTPIIIATQAIYPNQEILLPPAGSHVKLARENQRIPDAESGINEWLQGYLCPFSGCRARFNFRANLYVHIKRHTITGTVRCSICRKMFVNKTRLALHTPVCPAKKRFPCQHCSKKFNQHSHLKMHENAIHSKKEYLYCWICKKSYSSKGGHFKTHQFIHRGYRPYQCPDCGRSFTQKHRLWTHQLIHTNQKPFQCSHCGIGFREKKLLYTHLQRYHFNETFRCDTCGKDFDSEKGLYNHRRLVHTDTKFTCKTCGKQIKNKPSFKRHMLIHSEQKLFYNATSVKVFLKAT